MTEIRRKHGPEPELPRPAIVPVGAPEATADLTPGDGQVRTSEGAKALERIAATAPIPAQPFSGRRALGHLGRGIWHEAKEMLLGIKEHPVATVVTVAAAIALVAAAPVAGPVVLGLATAAFALAGAWKIGKGAAHALASYRTGDYAKAEAAFEEIGRGTFDVATSIGPTSSFGKAGKAAKLSGRLVRASKLGPLKPVAAQKPPVRVLEAWDKMTARVAAGFDASLATAKASGRLDAEALALVERVAGTEPANRAAACRALKAVEDGRKSPACALLDPSFLHAAGKAEIPPAELGRLTTRLACREGAGRAAKLVEVGAADATDPAFLEALAGHPPAGEDQAYWVQRQLQELVGGNTRVAINRLRALYPEISARFARRPVVPTPAMERLAGVLDGAGLSASAREAAWFELANLEGQLDLQQATWAINEGLLGTGEQVIRVGDRLAAASPTAVRDRLARLIPARDAIGVERRLEAGEDLSSVLFDVQKAHGQHNPALVDALDELRLFGGAVNTAGPRAVSEARLAELVRQGKLDTTQQAALKALLDHPEGLQAGMAKDLAAFARGEERLGITMHRLMEGDINRLPPALRSAYLDAAGSGAVEAGELTPHELVLLRRLAAASPEAMQAICQDLGPLADGLQPAWKVFHRPVVEHAAGKLGIDLVMLGRTKAAGVLRTARREIEMSSAFGHVSAADAKFVATLVLPAEPARLAEASALLQQVAEGTPAQRTEAVAALRKLLEVKKVVPATNPANMVRVGDQMVAADIQEIVARLERAKVDTGTLGRRLAEGQDLLAELNKLTATSPEGRLALAQLETHFAPPPGM